MCLTVIIIGKRREDSKASFPESKREPRRSSRFIQNELDCVQQKLRDVSLFPWFRFKSNQ